ncbi:MAG: AlwI family type II restriction endonuclease, partial [Planctomycetia bacterium]|nr:AlwI family type II restriction endonuclease [Planctomycetia bacterium]
MKNFNKKIEEQLFLLDKFWQKEENQNEIWNGNNVVQSRYCDFLQQEGMIAEEAPNKSKDALQKTSRLVDIGVIDAGRKLTSAGNELLRISQSGDFTSDNFLQIPKDSFIYLKQLLKMSCDVNGQKVRPFIVLFYLLSHLGYLTFEEFTYLLPLCITSENTEFFLEKIRNLRTGRETIDDLIVCHLMNMTNYQEALNYFLQTTVSEEVVCNIGMNRKGGTFDKPYYPLFQVLYQVFVLKKTECISDIYTKTQKIKIGGYWRELFFDTVSEKAIRKAPLAHLKETPFLSIASEKEFRVLFFQYMHLFKAKATLRDYFDLNRRYFGTTDVFLFEDQQVKADIIPRHWFHSVIEKLYSLAFTEAENLPENCDLTEIAPCLEFSEKTVLEGINQELNTQLSSMNAASSVLEALRYQRFNQLIAKKFSDVQLLELLELL